MPVPALAEGERSRLAARALKRSTDGRLSSPVRKAGALSGRPTYFALLEWAGDGLVNIGNSFAPYAIEGSWLSLVDWSEGTVPAALSCAALPATPDPLAMQQIEAGPYDDPHPG